jgi:UDP-2-acetamido-3-amino-2,3-dideoxy-glucuronate N-acetyltransferase
VVDSAAIADSAEIGKAGSIWHLAPVRENAVLGRNCIVGRGAYVGIGVVMGDNCEVQNYASLDEPARLGDGVFIGPAVVLTNGTYPRGVRPGGELKSADDWTPVRVTIEHGASIGARATCVAPVSVGAWATVAAGAVVVKGVSPFALVAGVPAKRIAWVGHAGVPLTRDAVDEATWVCPETGRR